MSERRPFKRFQKKKPFQSIEQRVEEFIIRNSKNGYFTKVLTIPYKFEISESSAWDIVGVLLSNGTLESIHDDITGDMKLCETGMIYKIMDLERKRKRSGHKQSRPKRDKNH